MHNETYCTEDCFNSRRRWVAQQYTCMCRLYMCSPLELNRTEDAKKRRKKTDDYGVGCFFFHMDEAIRGGGGGGGVGDVFELQRAQE